jgi:hypothetical protein
MKVDRRLLTLWKINRGCGNQLSPGLDVNPTPKKEQVNEPAADK